MLPVFTSTKFASHGNVALVGNFISLEMHTNTQFGFDTKLKAVPSLMLNMTCMHALDSTVR